MIRRAVLDIGSNSLQMLVADHSTAGDWTCVADTTRITGLSASNRPGKPLHPEGRARSLAIIELYVKQMEKLGVEEMVAIGTACLRNASDGHDFADELERRFSLRVEIVSGEEEARLAFLGAVSGLDPKALDGGLTVFDIGGASAEIVSGDGRGIDFQASLPLGARLLTEKAIRSDPVSAADLHALGVMVRGELANLQPFSGSRPLVGLGGSITTLGAIHHCLKIYDADIVGGTVLSRREVGELITRLASMTVVERRNLPGLEPERAGIITAGAVTAAAIMDHLMRETVTVSDRGLRHGAMNDRMRSGRGR